MKPGNGCIQYHSPQPWFCGVLKIWWKPLVTWKELYAYNSVVHSHSFEHGLILGSPLSQNTTKPWLWTTVLYAFITWLHTNGFTNVSFLLKTFGYIPGFVDIHYHASHQWFHQFPEDSTKPWLWTKVLYASITWLHTNGFTITFLCQFLWSTVPSVSRGEWWVLFSTTWYLPPLIFSKILPNNF